MENILEIKKLLTYEINKYKRQKEELEKLNGIESLYEQIFPYFSSIENIIDNKDSVLILLEFINKELQVLLTEIIVKYKSLKNDEEEKNKIIKIFSEIFLKLKNDYNDIKLQSLDIYQYLTNNSNRIKNFKIVISRINYQQSIPINLIEELDLYFVERKISTVEQIKLLEYIRIYNKTLYERYFDVPASYKNDVLDILSIGFEEISDEELEYDSEIIDKVNLHYDFLKYRDDYEQYFEELKKEINDFNSLKYFIILMLKKIQNEILDINLMIQEKDFYVDKELRNELIENYKKINSLYLFFRSQYFILNEQTNELAIDRKVDLIYARDSSGNPYFLKDLKHVNREYLSKVEKLITSLLEGTLTNKELQGFTSRFKEFRKLKDDQIRIIIKPINPKLYCIIGVGVKKENRGSNMYETLCGRTYPTRINDSMILEDKLITQQVLDFIRTYKRKGNR